MDKKNIADIACQIIGFAGDAKSSAVEAMEAARAGDFKNASEIMENCKESFKKAHEIHSKVIISEARGEKIELTMLLMHASNIFTIAETLKITAEQYIKLCEEVKDGS